MWLCSVLGHKFIKRTFGGEYVTTHSSDFCWRCTAPRCPEDAR